MPHLLFFTTLILLSALFALIEIQIEGPNGWATTLPTWRLENRWTRLFYSSKPLTGYHLYVQLFIIGAIHLPFGLGLVPFTWAIEARLLSFFILFWILEDFLWFVLNPAFGLKRFRPEHIWWHAPTWWWLMPRDYWIFTPIGLLLYCASR
jgi:hypothetical protein